MNISPLYAICDLQESSRDLAYLSELLESKIGFIQLRAKTLPVNELRLIAAAAKELRDRIYPSARLILNDHILLALETGLDGVHLGQEDEDVSKAREILGRDAIIGLSTHTLEQARAANELDLSYLAFGPIFYSDTKSGHAEVTGVELLARVARVTKFPLVAIGGITPERAQNVYEAGAQSLAIISSLRNSNSLSETIAAFESAYRISKNNNIENKANV